MSANRWLTIIGIGEDGLDGLTPAAASALDQAVLIVGGARHLSLIGPRTAERLTWPVPLADAFPAIVARRGQPVVVLATGDPSWFGVARALFDIVPPNEATILPGRSAFSLAAARLGWALQDCVPISLHGRKFERLFPQLQPGARILALSWDGTTPQRAARIAPAGSPASWTQQRTTVPSARNDERADGL